MHRADLLVIGLVIVLALAIQLIMFRMRRSIEKTWGLDESARAPHDDRPRIVVKNEPERHD